MGGLASFGKGVGRRGFSAGRGELMMERASGLSILEMDSPRFSALGGSPCRQPLGWEKRLPGSGHSRLLSSGCVSGHSCEGWDETGHSSPPGAYGLALDGEAHQRFSLEETAEGAKF